MKKQVAALAARGESPAAFGAPSAAAALGTPFGRRCIPAPPHRAEKRAVGAPAADCVAPPSHIPDTAPHRAQNARWGPRSAVVAPLRRGPHGADCAPWGGAGVPTARTVRRGVEQRGASPPSVRRWTFTTGGYGMGTRSITSRITLSVV